MDALTKRAWDLYCEETKTDADVRDFWHELKPEVQALYLAKAGTLWVLCLNDFPVGVYSSEEKAKQARDEDEAQREKARRDRTGHKPMLYYHVHPFTMNADATL